ncbi:MAG TPA: asparagine synthase (glutamine-hydrolyzing) [Phnomibacter sp.]|nr:asparagine synthase (glutamine-hydrolyzing) [Phnomibacter sp.]
MCGIAGIIQGPGIETFSNGKGTQMLQALAHRGPDGEGRWKSEHGRVELLHRRLSIIDLSAASDQPLHYGDHVLVFNGELYNYRELKEELKQKGYRFNTTGDTEVIPAAYQCWGADCLHRMDGMFAFALYNKRTGKMIIARDRFGEKPLYFHAHYSALGKLDHLLFGSEMKALWAAGIPQVVHDSMMVNYLGLGFVQNPIVKTDTFFRNIQNLPPGYLLEIDTNTPRFTMKRWYEAYKRIGHLDDDDLKNEHKVIERFHDLLMRAVQRRLRSDVPVGTSLSGGLDSSCIVAAIHGLKKDHGPVEGWANVCFSAVFPGFDRDEDSWSRMVAEHFGISRYTVSPTATGLTEHFARLMYHQEEPLQSSSVFTQYMVYGAARDEAVSVLLDGQGADEILAGYPRYSHWYLQQLLRKSPRAMRTEKQLLQANGMLEQWGLTNYLAAWMPWQTAQALKQKARNQMMQAPLQREYLDAHFDTNTLFKPEVRTLEDMLYFNTFNYGLEELLRYADRNSMAHSREVRLPFLEHELVEFIFSLPARFKIRQGFGKWLLRKAMERYLPHEVAWRKGKTGFEPPQRLWMQDKGIREMIMESRKTLADKKMIAPSELDRRILDEGAHAANNYDWRYLCAAAMLH